MGKLTIKDILDFKNLMTIKGKKFNVCFFKGSPLVDSNFSLKKLFKTLNYANRVRKQWRHHLLHYNSIISNKFFFVIFKFFTFLFNVFRLQGLFLNFWDLFNFLNFFINFWCFFDFFLFFLYLRNVGISFLRFLSLFFCFLIQCF